MQRTTCTTSECEAVSAVSGVGSKAFVRGSTLNKQAKVTLDFLKTELRCPACHIEDLQGHPEMKGTH